MWSFLVKKWEILIVLSEKLENLVIFDEKMEKFDCFG
jgi:hypothetical protein